jgi:lipopolysaccharide biosynthesis glycosyltransferase
MNSDSTRQDDRSLDVVYAIDQRYLRQLVAAASSLFANCSQPERLRVTVLHNDLDTAACDWVTARLPHDADIRFRPVEYSRLDNLPLPTSICPWITPMSFARFLIPEYLADVPRALYLDADTVVLGDVLDILDVPLGDTALGAVVDPVIPTWGSPAGIQNRRLLARRVSTPYFNSGVLLIDIPRCLELDLMGRAVRYAEQEHEKILLADQEILNAVLEGAFTLLDPVWNTSARHVEQKEQPERDAHLDRTKILHYVGGRKPWDIEGDPVLRTDQLFHRYAPQDLPL